MFRPFLLASSLLLAPLALAAGPLDGTWKLTSDVGGRGLSETTFRFVGADAGKGKVFVRMVGDMAPGKRRAVDVTGSYTLKNGLLQMRFTGAKMDPAMMTGAEKARFRDPKVQADFARSFTGQAPPAYAVVGAGTKTVKLVPKGSKDPKEPTMVLKRVK